jgi:hypothetical protein
MADENDEVGYCKPPKKNRFSKGNSGNPRGRPKGSKNVSTIFHRMCQEKVRVTENGKQRMVTKFEASLLQLLNKAAGGDIRAMKESFALERMFAESEKHTVFETPDREKDEIVMRAMLLRMQVDNSSGQQIDASARSEES